MVSWHQAVSGQHLTSLSVDGALLRHTVEHLYQIRLPQSDRQKILASDLSRVIWLSIFLPGSVGGFSCRY